MQDFCEERMNNWETRYNVHLLKFILLTVRIVVNVLVSFNIFVDFVGLQQLRGQVRIVIW